MLRYSWFPFPLVMLLRESVGQKSHNNSHVYVPSHVDSGACQVTCLTNDKCNTSRNLKSICALKFFPFLLFLGSFNHHRMNKPELASWMMTDMWPNHFIIPTDNKPTTRHVRMAIIDHPASARPAHSRSPTQPNHES